MLKHFTCKLKKIFFPSSRQQPERPSPRYFAIITPGQSGSLWLTKFLNYHPEVICWHEGVLQRIFPRRYWQVKTQDVNSWFKSISHPSANHYRKIFKAIGDVGSLGPETIGQAEILNNFTTFGLIRHPVLFIRSQLTSYHEFKALPRPLYDQINKFTQIAKKRFPDLNKLKLVNLADKQFVYACWRWLYYTEAIEKYSHKLFLLENITQPKFAIQAFTSITGLSCYPSSQVRPLVSTKINPHLQTNSYNPQAVYSCWSKQARKIFSLICGIKAKQLYAWKF